MVQQIRNNLVGLLDSDNGEPMNIKYVNGGGGRQGWDSCLRKANGLPLYWRNIGCGQWYMLLSRISCPFVQYNLSSCPEEFVRLKGLLTGEVYIQKLISHYDITSLVSAHEC